MADQQEGETSVLMSQSVEHMPIWSMSSAYESTEWYFSVERLDGWQSPFNTRDGSTKSQLAVPLLLIHHMACEKKHILLGEYLDPRHFRGNPSSTWYSPSPIWYSGRPSISPCYIPRSLDRIDVLMIWFIFHQSFQKYCNNTHDYFPGCLECLRSCWLVYPHSWIYRNNVPSAARWVSGPVRKGHEERWRCLHLAWWPVLSWSLVGQLSGLGWLMLALPGRRMRWNKGTAPSGEQPSMTLWSFKLPSINVSLLAFCWSFGVQHTLRELDRRMEDDRFCHTEYTQLNTTITTIKIILFINNTLFAQFWEEMLLSVSGYPFEKTWDMNPIGTSSAPCASGAMASKMATASPRGGPTLGAAVKQELWCRSPMSWLPSPGITLG